MIKACLFYIVDASLFYIVETAKSLDITLDNPTILCR